VTCTLVAAGPGCRVWRPSDEPWDEPLQAWAEAVRSLLAEEALPKVVADQGHWPDLDGDDLVNVLITSRVARTAADVTAYVRRVDFQPEVVRPWGQSWDVIYLQPGAPLETLRPILIHELTHVVQFSWCRAMFPGQPWPIPDWLTEGLAHAAELRTCDDLGNVRTRLHAFARQPHVAPLVVVDAGASGYWRHPGQRGASAAFCDWFTRTHPQWSWPELARAHAEHDDPWVNLTGQSFAETYRAWTVSLAASDAADQLPSAIKLRCDTLGPLAERTIMLQGTATAYVRLPTHQFETSARNHITWPPGAELQLTLVSRAARSTHNERRGVSPPCDAH
jgi:hypothetical protein